MPLVILVELLIHGFEGAGTDAEIRAVLELCQLVAPFECPRADLFQTVVAHHFPQVFAVLEGERRHIFQFFWKRNLLDAAAHEGAKTLPRWARDGGCGGCRSRRTQSRR